MLQMQFFAVRNDATVLLCSVFAKRSNVRVVPAFKIFFGQIDEKRLLLSACHRVAALSCEAGLIPAFIFRAKTKDQMRRNPHRSELCSSNNREFASETPPGSCWLNLLLINPVVTASRQRSQFLTADNFGYLHCLSPLPCANIKRQRRADPF
jgi:hypothetical protein